MSKIKNGALDQYGAKPFKQQQFGTAGVKRVKRLDESRRAGVDDYASACCDVDLLPFNRKRNQYTSRPGTYVT